MGKDRTSYRITITLNKHFHEHKAQRKRIMRDEFYSRIYMKNFYENASGKPMAAAVGFLVWREAYILIGKEEKSEAGRGGGGAGTRDNGLRYER